MLKSVFGRRSSIHENSASRTMSSAEAMASLASDEDIAAEAAALADPDGSDGRAKVVVQTLEPSPEAHAWPLRQVPLGGRGFGPGQGGHRPHDESRALLNEAGGREGILRFTNEFYRLCFADPHLDKFIREHDDPHGERFASWITEKFGVGTPWTDERRNRQVCPFQSHGRTLQTPHDRSSAHFAAWHSPKREPAKFGRHFKLDDARIWMRLHFLAMRTVGLYEVSPSFCAYYEKFVGHFVSVYERTAVQFTRESARWSEDPTKVERYIANGRVMDDVINVPLREALRNVPADERDGATAWPYI